jgi:beta-lactamase class A
MSRSRAGAPIRTLVAVAGALAALLALTACGATSAPQAASRPAATPAHGTPAHGPPATDPAAAPAAPASLQPVPHSPAAGQLAWVIGELNRRARPTTAELTAHFAASFLAAVPPAKLVAALAPLAAEGPLSVTGAISSPSPTELVAQVTGRDGTELKASIAVSPAAPHQIVGLLLAPLASPITSWSGVDTALERLASHASMEAGVVDGPVLHALNGTEPGAIGSAFKLYVLGALAHAVALGSVDWDTRLAIQNRWKSLPSGNMRLLPAGRTFALLHYAQQMISVSDNTAADHLIGRLGRRAVEAQLTALGNHSVSRNMPFLTTRELFALKLSAPPALRDAYASGDPAQRARLLPRVDRLTPTLAEAEGWTAPRSISTLEWFASPADLAGAISRLVGESRQPGLGPLRRILSINPGISLDSATWPYVGYKGGSEPGVISLTWYLQRHDGHTFVLSLVLNDPRNDISTFAAASVAEAAVALLARA